MSAIRALRQVAAPLVSRRTLCTATVPRVAGMRVASLQASKSFATRGFANSARRFAQGSKDVALSQKLQEELTYEKETGGLQDEVPDFLKDFEAQGIWQIEDIVSQEEVTLVRKFGNETIRLTFSIDDLQPMEEEFEREESEDPEAEDTHIFTHRGSMSITKSNGPGAIIFDMMIQDGAFMVDNVTYYDDAKAATDMTAEANWNRRAMYLGPDFHTLDVTVQDQFEAFLKERGVDGSLATFIPQYALHKEQKEYVSWLTKVKSFVDL